MLERKPGRVLFWASLITGAMGWVYALLNKANPNRPEMAIAALFFWFVAFCTGLLWLKVKWTQTKTRAQAEAWAAAGGTPAQLAAAGHRKPRGFAAKVMVEVAIAIAIVVTGLLVYTAVNADKIPLPPAHKGSTGATVTAAPARHKHHRAHAKTQQPSTTEADTPPN